MSIRLHALGFPAQWSPRMLQLVDTLARESSKLVGSAKGNYRVWRSQQGAELWFHLPQRAARQAEKGSTGSFEDAGSKLRPSAVTPFHRGLSSCQIRIGRYLHVDRANPLEGSCLAWLPASGLGSREQVIVLELAPYGLQPMRTPPHATTAQIVCFAHALWAWPDGAAYARETPSNRRIQLGAFSPVTEADVPEVKLTYASAPITLGLATGHVRRVIRHMNPVTREPYYWLLLETKRGTFDVIANPSQISGDASEGHIVQVCGSFVARLAGTPV